MNLSERNKIFSQMIKKSIKAEQDPKSYSKRKNLFDIIYYDKNINELTIQSNLLL